MVNKEHTDMIVIHADASTMNNYGSWAYTINSGPMNVGISFSTNVTYLETQAVVRALSKVTRTARSVLVISDASSVVTCINGGHLPNTKNCSTILRKARAKLQEITTGMNISAIHVRSKDTGKEHRRVHNAAKGTLMRYTSELI